jgi:hypothetical protein
VGVRRWKGAFRVGLAWTSLVWTGAAGCASRLQSTVLQTAAADLHCGTVAVDHASPGPVTTSARRSGRALTTWYDGVYEVTGCGQHQTYSCGYTPANDAWQERCVARGSPGDDTAAPNELVVLATRELDCLDPPKLEARPPSRFAKLLFGKADLVSFNAFACGRGAEFVCAIPRVAGGGIGWGAGEDRAMRRCARMHPTDDWDAAPGSICDGTRPAMCDGYCATWPGAQDCAEWSEAKEREARTAVERGEEHEIAARYTEAATVYRAGCDAGVLDACRGGVSLLDRRVVPASRSAMVAALRPLCAARDKGACDRLRTMGEPTP